MAKVEWYRQCRLRREHPDYPKTVMESWIREEIAKVGDKVKIRNKASEPWSEHWLVLEVWGRDTKENLVKNEMNYKHQRSQSDV